MFDNIWRLVSESGPLLVGFAVETQLQTDGQGGLDLVVSGESALLNGAGQGLPAGCSPDIPQDALYIVTDLYPDHVVLDGNHPLAGVALKFSVAVTGVRAALPEEIAHRHVHGEHGHHH